MIELVLPLLSDKSLNFSQIVSDIFEQVWNLCFEFPKQQRFKYFGIVTFWIFNSKRFYWTSIIWKRRVKNYNQLFDCCHKTYLPIISLFYFFPKYCRNCSYCWFESDLENLWENTSHFYDILNFLLDYFTCIVFFKIKSNLIWIWIVNFNSLNWTFFLYFSVWTLSE